MNSKSNKPQDLSVLLQEYFGGTISEQDLRLLDDNLRRDSSAREQLRQFAVLEEGLADFAAVTSSQAFGSDSVYANLPSKTPGKGWWSIAGTLSATASVLLLAFLLKDNFLTDKSSIPDSTSVATNLPNESSTPKSISVAAKQEGDTPRQTFVAYLVEEIDAQFENPELDTTLGFKSGSYVLRHGSVHLRFRNGADFVLESPARFAILDDMTFRLYDGRLRAIFPPDAGGFRVLTPGVEYHDLRAEVGVYADSLETRSDLHVFGGHVSSRIPGSSDPIDTFDTRQAVVYRNGILEKGVFDRSRFLKPGQIGFQRWQRLRSKLRVDPDVIGYYTFTETSTGVIPNQAHLMTPTNFDVMSNGNIGAATWVAGRWPQKRALMFEMEGDHVELDIPGEYDELTFAVWLKLDRLDHSQNSILCSDGWHPGAIHWQLNRSGGPWLASFAPSSTIDIKRCVPVGQWFHLTSTISSETGTAQTFLNGELVSEFRMSDSISLRPGKCRLGNWLKNAHGLEQRTLKGRIDELVVMRRTLNREEIRDLFEQGKPAASWRTRQPIP